VFTQRKANINTGFQDERATGMNTFLISLNIPWVDRKTFKTWEEEARDDILEVSKSTCELAVQQEVEAVHKKRMSKAFLD